MDPAALDALLEALAASGTAAALFDGKRLVGTNGPARSLGDEAALAGLLARAAEHPVSVTVEGKSLEVRASAPAGPWRVLVGVDVTERDVARREHARSDELLKVGAHELRNPLHVIGMIVHLLDARATRGEPLDRSSLDRLRRQVDRMNRLITQLIDLSRVQEDRLHIDFVDEDLAALLQAELAQLPAKRRNDFHVDAVASAPIRACAEGRLAEVVHQLIDNAARFTDSGTRVDVRLRTCVDDGRWELRVADQGPGLGAETRASLFRRDPKPDPRGTVGLRLGLYLAWHVVQLHQGLLEFVATRPDGTGATFVLRLPKRA